MSFFFALIAAFLVAGFLGRFLFKIFFEDFEDLCDCLGSVFSASFISLFQGTLLEDMWKSLKAIAFVLGVGFSGVVTFNFVEAIGMEEEAEEIPIEESRET